MCSRRSVLGASLVGSARNGQSVAVSADFTVGVEFPWLRGPFRAFVQVEEDFIEVVPTGLLKRAGVKPVRVERSDVFAIERDRWRRRGLRFRTRSRRIDNFIVVPNNSTQRRRFHEAIDAHGYPLVG